MASARLISRVNRVMAALAGDSPSVQDEYNFLYYNIIIQGVPGYPGTQGGFYGFL